ncbi:hypothetical protein E2C01_042749 [Portunus trituberculatus]|uniref:Uncharacterized protein n=1 Tax=Portunus trituberculatus TaxID=210409 RepID=A0A5B7FR19_PORTR|nr:hypothetical protein [Portunus trituberculatus]
MIIRCAQVRCGACKSYRLGDSGGAQGRAGIEEKERNHAREKGEGDPTTCLRQDDDKDEGDGSGQDNSFGYMRKVHTTCQAPGHEWEQDARYKSMKER